MPLPLIEYTIRIVPPREHMQNAEMDRVLYVVHGKRTPEQVAEFIRENILDADGLEGFSVEVEVAIE